MKCKKGYKKVGNKCTKKKSFAKVFSSSSNYGWFFWILGIAILAGVFVYGGYSGWFKGVFQGGNTYSIIEGDINNFLDSTSSGECTLDLNPNSIYEGDRVTGTIHDGANTLCYVIANDGTSWSIVGTIMTDANGNAMDTRNIDVVGNFVFRAICDVNKNGDMDTGDCITNKETLTVYERPSEDDAPPEDEGYEVGDNVGSGIGDSGTGTFGENLITTITMDWTTGGPYILGAKITRTWSYVNPGCTGPEQYPMEWTLYDSNGMAWQKYDYVPVTNEVDYVCPVTYHEDAPWKFDVRIGIQECDVQYSWNVQPYICEVNE